MKVPQQEKFAVLRPAAVPRIYIVGANNLQNMLLGTHIEKETGLLCSCSPDMDALPIEKQTLVLYDCFSVEHARIWIRLEPLLNRIDPENYISLFNVIPDVKLEKEAVNQGVRGVFYYNESPGNLSKGVEAILRGELWYSRKTTSRLLLDNDRHTRLLYMTRAGLTAREKEILLSIGAGFSNSDISDKFNISAHTVKNHIYNIYRKIKVKNRLEAILWVTQYL